jgi:hypothetical protein
MIQLTDVFIRASMRTLQAGNRSDTGRLHQYSFAQLQHQTFTLLLLLVYMFLLL